MIIIEFGDYTVIDYYLFIAKNYNFIEKVNIKRICEIIIEQKNCRLASTLLREYYDFINYEDIDKLEKILIESSDSIGIAYYLGKQNNIINLKALLKALRDSDDIDIMKRFLAEENTQIYKNVIEEIGLSTYLDDDKIDIIYDKFNSLIEQYSENKENTR